jgi:hypothetical protein
MHLRTFKIEKTKMTQRQGRLLLEYVIQMNYSSWINIFMVFVGHVCFRIIFELMFSRRFKDLRIQHLRTTEKKYNGES